MWSDPTAFEPSLVTGLCHQCWGGRWQREMSVWGQRGQAEKSANGPSITRGYRCEADLGEPGISALVSDNVDSRGQSLMLFSTKSWKLSKGVFKGLCCFPFLEQLRPHRPPKRCNSRRQVFSSVLSGPGVHLFWYMFKGCSSVYRLFILGFFLCPTLPAG